MDREGCSATLANLGKSTGQGGSDVAQWWLCIVTRSYFLNKYELWSQKSRSQQIYELILRPHLCWEGFSGLKEFCKLSANLRYWLRSWHVFLPEEDASHHYPMCRQLNSEQHMCRKSHQCDIASHLSSNYFKFWFPAEVTLIRWQITIAILRLKCRMGRVDLNFAKYGTARLGDVFNIDASCFKIF